MNRLVVALAAVASSYVVACAAPTADGIDAPQPSAAESETIEAVPHSTPAKMGDGPVAREGYVIEAGPVPGAFVERRIDQDRTIPTPTPKPGLESDIEKENIEAPVPRDQDGVPLRRLSDEEIKRMVATKEIQLPETQEPKAVYYQCNKWIYPRDVVFCGTNFFGWSPLFINNCSYQGGVFFSGGTYYWVPPARNVNGYTLCHVVDWSGWHWGKSYGFNNVGSVPLYVTH